MNIKTLIDDIEDEVQLAGLKVWWDQFQVLDWLSSELNKVSGESEFEGDWFYFHLDPAVTTISGMRYYDLPANFGANFVPNSGEKGDEWCCLLDDGSNENPLDYISAVRFFSKNLTGQSNGTPTEYTIISKPDGRKQIALSPPPDDEYTIDGLYKPTDWDLKNTDSVPPIPGNSMILKYGVLKRIDQRWERDYAQARASLAMEVARSRKARIVPGYGAAINTYSRINRSGV